MATMTLKTQDIYHTSCFPSILNSHPHSEGMEKAVTVAKVVTQMKKLKDRRLQRPASAAEVQKKKALLEKRHQESYRRLHRLKDSLSQRYAELLTEKVQRQRQQMKQHGSFHLKTAAKHTRQSSRDLIFRELDESTLKDNAAFLKSLPKTRYYLILELQRQLGQRDFLQSIREQEVFRSWVDQSKTAQLEKQLQQMELSSKSSPELKLEDLLKKKSEVLPKIQISLEESINHHDAFLKSGGEGRERIIVTPALQGKQNQEQEESERRFPSVLQVPRFSSLQPSFLKAFRTNIDTSKANESLHKSKNASVAQLKLHLMYRLSLFNMAQSRSLLIKNGLMPQYDNGYRVQDMMHLVYPNIDSTKEPICGSDPPLSPQLLSDNIAPEYSKCIKEEMNAHADQVYSSEPSEELQSSCNRASSGKVPLSMKDIYSCSTLLGKTFDKKMWSNYA